MQSDWDKSKQLSRFQLCTHHSLKSVSMWVGLSSGLVESEPTGELSELSELILPQNKEKWQNNKNEHFRTLEN